MAKPNKLWQYHVQFLDLWRLTNNQIKLHHSFLNIQMWHGEGTWGTNSINQLKFDKWSYGGNSFIYTKRRGHKSLPESQGLYIN